MPPDILGVGPRVKGTCGVTSPPVGIAAPACAAAPKLQGDRTSQRHQSCRAGGASRLPTGTQPASGRTHRVKRGPQRGPPLQARGPRAGEQAPPHLRRSPLLHSGSRARTQRAGNPSAAPDQPPRHRRRHVTMAPASEVQAPRISTAALGTSSRSPGSWSAAVRFKRSSVGATGALETCIAMKEPSLYLEKDFDIEKSTF
ncbi:hypothetical protein NDU88_006511 [Pleurodeles waltl]|uniref:Uncharacterized protein n=1 Tax=Pleurodeles waltl TaxID=8319 RepID=A0AAV7TE74_PLEWA|nr:hypothetical protein NDU88_006511 [Pleurodeles waltl]